MIPSDFLAIDKARRVHKKALRELVKACDEALKAIDTVMKGPSTVERGRRIAKIANYLESAKDSAKMFGGLKSDRKAVKPGKCSGWDRAVMSRLSTIRLTKPGYELVWAERRDLEDITGRKPAKDWEVVRLSDGRVCQRPQPEWQPVVHDTLTQLSNGSWAYLFDSGKAD